MVQHLGAFQISLISRRDEGLGDSLQDKRVDLSLSTGDIEAGESLGLAGQPVVNSRLVRDPVSKEVDGKPEDDIQGCSWTS